MPTVVTTRMGLCEISPLAWTTVLQADMNTNEIMDKVLITFKNTSTSRVEKGYPPK